MKEICERNECTLGYTCPSYKTVILWVIEFKRGRTSIDDAPRPKTQKSAVTLENIDKVHDIILAKTLVEMRESAKAVGILIDRVK